MKLPFNYSADKTAPVGMNAGGYWLNTWVNYQGWNNRPVPTYPLVDFMSVFAEKKANILVQEIKVICNSEEVQAFINKTDWTRLVRNCIQQASMNGYAIIDIERLPNESGIFSTYAFINPFPSVFGEWLVSSVDNKCKAIQFSTGLNSQRFLNNNYFIFSKDSEKFTIANIAGFMNQSFLIGAYPYSFETDSFMKYISNPLFDNSSIRYDKLIDKKTGKRIWPHIDKEHTPFYLWNNKDYNLGTKNLIQNSDMWFLGNFGHLISSYLERIFQEQTMNITRVIGNFDPNIQNQLQNETGSDSLLSQSVRVFGDKNVRFSFYRAFAFTNYDNSQVNQFPSTYNGSAEIQGFKDLLDLCFKWSCGFEMFGESATAESTATSELQRAVSEKEAIKMTQTFIKKQLTELIETVLFYEYGDGIESKVDLGFDIVIDNERSKVSSAQANQIQGLYGAGLMSKKEALSQLHPNWNEKQIQDEIDNLSYDFAMQQEVSSMYNPSQTSAEEQESNGVQYE